MLNLTDLQESLGGFMCLNNIHINVITQSFPGKMSLIQHFFSLHVILLWLMRTQLFKILLTFFFLGLCTIAHTELCSVPCWLAGLALQSQQMAGASHC